MNEELTIKNEQLKKLKVFRMNDFDCFADYSLEEAIKHYKEMSLIDDDEIDDPREYSEEELDALKIVEIDEPNHPTHTFKEWLDGFDKPGFFSSTEY